MTYKPKVGDVFALVSVSAAHFRAAPTKYVVVSVTAGGGLRFARDDGLWKLVHGVPGRFRPPLSHYNYANVDRWRPEHDAMVARYEMCEAWSKDLQVLSAVQRRDVNPNLARLMHTLANAVRVTTANALVD